MKSINRDLLLLTRKASSDKKEMEEEVEKLNQLLLHVESMMNFCIANEIIDVANYRIIEKPQKIEKIIRANRLKSFQFIFNKN